MITPLPDRRCNRPNKVGYSTLNPNRRYAMTCACGLIADCVCFPNQEEVTVIEMYALTNGPAYRKTVGSQPNWALLYDYVPLGTEVYVLDGWEYVDGICCEVWRHPNGGLIAQPTKVVELVDVTPAVKLELAA